MKLKQYLKYGLAACLLSPAASADETALLKDVNDNYDRVASISKQLWDWAEVGYQEEKSSALLQHELSSTGFTIEKGVADIPTAFVASYGSGGPVIAILAEFDALPGINQSTSPERDPIHGKGAGHACGHNLFGAASVQTAISIRNWLEMTGTPGTIKLYGTPAEEGGSGKVYMVREGLFEDVDFVIHWHPDSRNSAAARTTLANRSAKFRFIGKSAHAAGNPDRARSALDGVEAMNMMVNMMREHVPQESRIHYVITQGGFAPNVVPDFAEVFYYLRHPKSAMVEEMWKRLEATAQGAALGTGTKVEWEIIHGNHPILVNETLQRVADSKLRQLGGIKYNAEEQAFAERLYASFDKPHLALGSQEDVQPFSISQGYGSTDVGDVSMVVPTVGLRAAGYVPGTPGHSWQSVASSGNSVGFKGAHYAAKGMALIAKELFENEDLRTSAREEFDRRRGPDFEYRALLGDRKPPLDYRK